MVEKNGTTDAFRYFVHRATGGSDHLCFNNANVAVPGIEFFTWPDQWYHADTDTPDKSDPTQMKRVAFIGAACAWTAAHCSDEVLDGLLDVTSEFGYARIAEREHVKALNYIEEAGADELAAAAEKAFNLINFAAEREISALHSIAEIYTASENAEEKLKNRVAQWELYKKSIHSQLLAYSALKAEQLGIRAPQIPELTNDEKKYDRVVPSIHPEVKGAEFSLSIISN